MHILLQDLDHLEGSLREAGNRPLESLLIGVVLEDQIEVVSKLGMHPGILTIFYFIEKPLDHPIGYDLKREILLWSVDICDYSDNGLVGDLCQHFGPTVQQLDQTLPLLDELVGNLLEIILH
jgi:hypothetical protein